MDYVVTQAKQIAITADNPEEAQKKILNGEGTTISSSITATPRLQSGQSAPMPIGRVMTNQFQSTQTEPTPKLNG